MNNKENLELLGKYAINLNERARSGKLDPVIGRDEEIRRVLQILSQPDPGRRAGRGQDRHFRRDRPADHQWRCA